MLKAVIDTNVLVSGLLKTSRICRKIIQKLSVREFELIVSPPIIEELIEVIARPKFHTIIERATAEKLIGIIRSQAILVKPSRRLNVIKEDPADNRFLEAAVEGKADLLVSGDKALLSLKSFEDIPILTPQEFLKRLK